jgi:hypothetical protein
MGRGEFGVSFSRPLPRFSLVSDLPRVGHHFQQSFPRSTRRQPKTSFGPVYTIECPYCTKQFKRRTSDTHLNEHKDRFGNRCYGRTGFIASIG